MKKSFILSLLFFLAFSACEEPPVVFIGAQPEGLDPTSSIDIIYRGTFICESDTALVHIKGKTIYKEKAFAFTITPEELAEMDDAQLFGDQLILDDWPEPLPAKVTDSLIYSSIVLKDTLFHMGPDQILKMYKGHLILNKKIDEDKWEVMVLSLDYDLDLRLATADIPEDLEKLKQLTPVQDISTEDKTQLLVAPTVRQFDQILKTDLIFQECDMFIRSHGAIEI